MSDQDRVKAPGKFLDLTNDGFAFFVSDFQGVAMHQINEREF